MFVPTSPNELVAVFIGYGMFVPFGKITTIQPTCCLEKVAGFGAAMHKPIELAGRLGLGLGLGLGLAGVHTGVLWAFSLIPPSD